MRLGVYCVNSSLLKFLFSVYHANNKLSTLLLFLGIAVAVLFLYFVASLPYMSIFCGFGAVVFEPFRNDSHQAVQIERHKVRFLTLRYAVAVEYRRDDIAGKSLIAVLQPQCGRVFDPRAEQALVLLDVAEIRHQIFRRNEIKLVHSAWRSANVAWGGSLQNCGRLQPM